MYRLLAATYMLVLSFSAVADESAGILVNMSPPNADYLQLGLRTNSGKVLPIEGATIEHVKMLGKSVLFSEVRVAKNKVYIERNSRIQLRSCDKIEFKVGRFVP